MLVKVHYTGHYPAEYYELTNEELKRLRECELIGRGYVEGSKEGCDYLESLKSKRVKGPDCAVVCGYV